MTVFSHGNMVFGRAFVVFSFFLSFFFGSLAMVFADKSHNMENLWALAIKKSIIFIMSTTYGIQGIVTVGHNSMFFRFLVLGIRQIAFQTMRI